MPLSFDLVLATLARVDEPARLFESLERQTHRDFRVLLVDQNDDDRLEPLLELQRSFEVVRLRARPGLSHARNAALSLVEADAVGFPDDDCVYPDDLLERVAERLSADPTLDGLAGREPSWTRSAAVLTRRNLWNRAISFTIFLRSSIVERVGSFDEVLGLPASSGEEIEYLIRAIGDGARIEYDPALVVDHPEKTHDGAAVGSRDGASVGYILRKHRYPWWFVARMLVRPAGGALLAAARRDRADAIFHLETLRGRLHGYRDFASVPS
jgi:glycosyltransferase involved in cell wall biosynthesis